ncbi:MAG: MoaD/ThiS family protein [Verrucomicrobiae bacterium]|nr:MoaD/ThiS family protein [Verrucomicrobiae bacterium]
MIRVTLPYHLRNLARVQGDVCLDVPPPITLATVLAALEIRYPTLRGTLRDHHTLKRRPFIRFYACREDWSHQPPDAELPVPVRDGHEPLLIVGAMAGG